MSMVDRFAAKAVAPLRLGVFAGLLMVLLSGCSTIKSSHSELVVKPAARIDAMRVVVDPNAAVRTRVSTTVPVSSSAAFEQGSSNYTARLRLQEIARLLVFGFRNRFPVLAVPYGLSITPAARYAMHVKIETSETSCGGGHCRTSVMIRARVVDAAETLLWSSTVEFGQASTTALIDNAMFDAVAVKLLDSMKRDGLIGR